MDMFHVCMMQANITFSMFSMASSVIYISLSLSLYLSLSLSLIELG